MSIKQKLGAIGLTLAIGLSSCNNNKSNEPDYIDGTVLKESGTLVDRQKVIESSRGSFFGNESIRFGDPTYAIQFQTDDKNVYTFAIEESSQKKLEALNLAIDVGTRIRMTKFNFYWNLEGTVGKIYDYELEVLGNE